MRGSIWIPNLQLKSDIHGGVSRLYATDFSSELRDWFAIEAAAFAGS
jgi:hypothetical protein